jgi:hypothetical protein
VAPAAATVVQGATVAVTIQIDNVSNLFGAEVHLTFDPALIEVVDADVNTAGTQIGHGGFLSPDFVARNEVNQPPGHDYAISNANHAAATGSGVLATEHLQGENPQALRRRNTTALLADSNGAGKQQPRQHHDPGSPPPAIRQRHPAPTVTRNPT